MLVLVTVGLLVVAAYAATVSTDDGPGATPLLMAGLLVLCTIAMTVMSAVATALLARAAKARWWIRVVLVAAALVVPALLFPLAAYAGDPAESLLTRRVMLALFVAGVAALFALNRIGMAWHRRSR